MKVISLISLFTLFLNAQEVCLEGEKNCILESNQKPFNSVKKRINILGSKLTTCSKEPLTGFFRDGTCYSNAQDQGNHSVCAKLSNEFLSFTKAQGNDLSTPNPRYNFPGLKAGDYWCLCAARWLEAKKAGINLEVNASATSNRSFMVTNNFDFKWKKRVIKVPLSLYKSQSIILEENLTLKDDLKLIVVPDKKISVVQLIGLDGKIKKTNKSVFQINDLEKIINSMPMRKAELNNPN